MAPPTLDNLRNFLLSTTTEVLSFFQQMREAPSICESFRGASIAAYCIPRVQRVIVKPTVDNLRNFLFETYGGNRSSEVSRVTRSWVPQYVFVALF